MVSVWLLLISIFMFICGLRCQHGTFSRVTKKYSWKFSFVAEIFSKISEISELKINFIFWCHVIYFKALIVVLLSLWQQRIRCFLLLSFCNAITNRWCRLASLSVTILLLFLTWFSFSSNFHWFPPSTKRNRVKCCVDDIHEYLKWWF